MWSLSSTALLPTAKTAREKRAGLQPDEHGAVQPDHIILRIEVVDPVAVRQSKCVEHEDIPALAAGQPVAAGTAIEDVVASAAAQIVGTGAAVEDVVAVIAADAVRARTAAYDVIAGAALQPIGARATDERVGAGAAEQLVVAGAAVERIVERRCR